MARMHSRDKGKSGSSKPINAKTPVWQTHNPKEIELLIVKLAKQGMKSSEIGLHLRDSYGIPSVKLACKKNITKILAEKEMSSELPEDLYNLMKKSVFLRKHLEANHKDQPGVRGLQLTNSKIMRLVKYYKRTHKIAKDWKFDPEKIKLFIE